MKKKFSFLLCFAVAAFFSCDPGKKTAQTPAAASNQGEAKTEESNPTLKKLNAKMIDNNTFQLEGISEDPTYGYSSKNAVKVGGGDSGPLNERRFLNALLGPDGQTVTYRRLGSCCPVESKNGFMGKAMLDNYEVTYEGLAKPVNIFINMYDPGVLKAPKGFTFKKL